MGTSAAAAAAASTAHVGGFQLTATGGRRKAHRTSKHWWNSGLPRSTLTALPVGMAASKAPAGALASGWSWRLLVGAFGLVETGTDWQQGMSGEPCTDSRSQHGIACGHVERSSSKITYSQLRDRQSLHKHAAKLRWRPQQRRWERRRRTDDAGSGGKKDGSSKAVWAGATTMAAALTAAPAATAAASTSIRRVRSAAAERGSVRCAPPVWRFELLQLMHPRHHARSIFETPAASP